MVRGTLQHDSRWGSWHRESSLHGGVYIWSYIFRLGEFEITGLNGDQVTNRSNLVSPENLTHSKHSKLSVDLLSAKDSCAA